MKAIKNKGQFDKIHENLTNWIAVYKIGNARIYTADVTWDQIQYAHWITQKTEPGYLYLFEFNAMNRDPIEVYYLKIPKNLTIYN